MIVLNFFGAPGVGKSTGAAYIFAKLKMAGINAELVTEFAKDKVWEESQQPFKNQAYIFGEQYFRLSRCKYKVDVIVTDSPLALSVLYNNNYELGESFNETVINVFNSFENKNYFVCRTKPYNPVGRLHSESESDALVSPLIDVLDRYGIDYEFINGDINDYDSVVESVLNYLKTQPLTTEEA